VVTVAVAAALLATGATAYLLHSRSARRGAGATATREPTTAAGAVLSGPPIVFRTTAIGPD
jgi:hypothetical protein